MYCCAVLSRRVIAGIAVVVLGVFQKDTPGPHVGQVRMQKRRWYAAHIHVPQAVYAPSSHQNHPRPEFHSITTSFLCVHLLLLLRFALLHPDAFASEVVGI